MPVRLRLTLITAVLMACVIGAMGVFLSTRFESGMRYALEKGLRSRAQSIVAAIQRGDVLAFGEGVYIETDEAFAQIIDRDGEVVETSGGIDRRPLADPIDIEDTRLFDADVRTSEPDTPLTPSMLFVVGAPDRMTVVVGASVEDEQEALAGMRKSLILGGGGAVLASGLVAWFMAGLALRPVEQLIDRLRASLERERRFVDDASHELRTPLSVLRTELDVALRHQRSPQEMEATLRSALQETERLQALAEDLLLLARSGDGMPIRPEPVDVAALASAAADRSGSIVVDVPDGLSVHADPVRLRQALDNLIANGLRYGDVLIGASRNGTGVEITVEDTGPGFDEAFLPRAFDAFTRADDGRTRDAGGTGLGLAIVKAIAVAHGGTVTASNRSEGGARVTLALPR